MRFVSMDEMFEFNTEASIVVMFVDDFLLVNALPEVDRASPQSAVPVRSRLPFMSVSTCVSALLARFGECECAGLVEWGTGEAIWLVI
jgi:hypothetical protein